MTLVLPEREAVLAPATASSLHELLRFRHFLRHAYAVDLSWTHLRELAASLPGLRASVTHDLAGLRAFLGSCEDEAGRGDDPAT